MVRVPGRTVKFLSRRYPKEANIASRTHLFMLASEYELISRSLKR